MVSPTNFRTSVISPVDKRDNIVIWTASPVFEIFSPKGVTVERDNKYYMVIKKTICFVLRDYVRIEFNFLVQYHVQ